MVEALFPPQLLFGYFVVLGAILGSFANVVIVRWPNDESIVRPRSRCPTCKTPIAWYDNIPLVSFIVLRARCRHCKAPIPWRYPLVELLMALLAGSIYLRFGWSWDLLLWLFLATSFLIITFIDIDHWFVPDLVTFPAMAVALGFSFVPGGLGPLDALLGVTPALGLWALAWVFEKLAGKEGMGMGDIKLLVVIGLALGWLGAFNVLVLASFQGSVIGIIVALTGGHRGAEPPEASGGADDEDDDWAPTARHIPFGPFLVLSCLEVVLMPDTFGDLVGRLMRGVAEAIT